MDISESKLGKLTVAMLAAGAVGAGATAIHSDTVSAATFNQNGQRIQNDASVVTAKHATRVYNSNNTNAQQATGQILGRNTHWKVIKTAINSQGQKWYDLGKNQWVNAKDVAKGYQNITATQSVQNATPVSQATSTAPVSQAPKAQQVVSAPTQNVNAQYQHIQTTSTNSQQVQSTARTQVPAVSGSEASARAYIVGRESGGSYSARNGQYIGKYQLSAAYLHGDYSPANQERVAQQYMQQRYGSWQAAAQHHRTFGWW